MPKTIITIDAYADVAGTFTICDGSLVSSLSITGLHDGSTSFCLSPFIYTAVQLSYSFEYIGPSYLLPLPPYRRQSSCPSSSVTEPSCV